MIVSGHINMNVYFVEYLSQTFRALLKTSQTQLAFTYPKLTIETLEQGVKYLQSLQ